jgi:hypothetical protein
LKQLEFPFNRDGFTHELVERIGDVCLVHRHKGGRQSHFEVVRLLHAPEKTFPNGHVTPAHEAYPSSEHWGLYGFTYRDEAKARNRFRLLEVAQNAAFSSVRGIRTPDRAEDLKICTLSDTYKGLQKATTNT